MSFIKGGFTTWARQTFDSEIFFNKPDKWFKIWFYIVSRVNFKDYRRLERGQNHFTYTEIMDATRATRAEIDHCLRWLKSATMISTKKATRGLVITVLNYAKFQDQKNYKSDTEIDPKSDTEAKQKRQDIQEEEELNNIADKSAGITFNSMVYEHLEDGDITYDDDSPKKKPGTYGRYPMLVVTYYMNQMGKRGDGRGYLKAAKELMRVAEQDFPEDPRDEHLKEIKVRIDIAIKYYKLKNVSDWRLDRLVENWDKLPDWKKLT